MCGTQRFGRSSAAEVTVKEILRPLSAACYRCVLSMGCGGSTAGGGGSGKVVVDLKDKGNVESLAGIKANTQELDVSGNALSSLNGVGSLTALEKVSRISTQRIALVFAILGLTSV